MASALAGRRQRGAHRGVPAVGAGSAQTEAPSSAPWNCVAEAEPVRHVAEHLVGVEVAVVAQQREVHRRHAEVGDDVELAGRLRVLVVVGLGEVEQVHRRGGQRPVGGGGHVGQQHPTSRPCTRTSRKKSSSTETMPSDPLSLGHGRSASTSASRSPAATRWRQRLHLPRTFFAVGDTAKSTLSS